MSAETCTVTETAELLGVSRTRVMHLLSMKKLEGEKQGSRYLITRSSVYRRIASVDTPPGVQRLLYRGRFVRELTRPRDAPSSSRWNWQGTLTAYARHLFGSPEAAPYRAKLHSAACEVFKAVKLRDWRRVERAQAELHLVWLEYEFVAEPLEPAFKTWVAPESLQVSLFNEEAK